MDGNKDEAFRCISIAEEAIASGYKERALKFIKIAQRLDHNMPVIELLTKCEGLDSGSSATSTNENCVSEDQMKPGSVKYGESLIGERNCMEEHVELVRHIKRNNDYYAILGVEKTCEVEEIKRAYRKLSLKVHPDKNKAPGSEEAFKKVSKAFKCLSDGDSRRQYDQTGLVEEFESNQRHNFRYRRRRRTPHDLFADEFDPDEIFRAFFGQSNVFHTTRTYTYRARGMDAQQREEFQGGGLNIMLLLQLLPFLIIFLLAYLPFREPDYSLHKNYSYQIPKTTERHGIEFYVKSEAFDPTYPPGSLTRANIEDNVIKDYKNAMRRYCHVELQRRQWNQNLPTPHCEKLRNLGIA